MKSLEEKINESVVKFLYKDIGNEIEKDAAYHVLEFNMGKGNYRKGFIFLDTRHNSMQIIGYNDIEELNDMLGYSNYLEDMKIGDIDNSNKYIKKLRIW